MFDLLAIVVPFALLLWFAARSQSLSGNAHPGENTRRPSRCGGVAARPSSSEWPRRNLREREVND